jgi:hypothetical protein
MVELELLSLNCIAGKALFELELLTLNCIQLERQWLN